MSWFSILPAHLTVVETWIIRFFVSPFPNPLKPNAHESSQLFLGTVTIIPWVLALIYDMLLYLIRAISYEIPYYGGRAQGKLRPQAPKLTERPNGRKRTFSISSPVGDGAVGSGKERRTGKEDESSEDEAVDLTFEGLFDMLMGALTSWDVRLTGNRESSDPIDGSLGCKYG